MRWQDKPTARFEDMPRHLVDVGLDSPEELKQERAEWLETNGLSLVGLLAWKRSRDPSAAQRPPSRRKFMTPEQLAAFERQREEEPFQW